MANIPLPCSMALDEFVRTRRNILRFWNLLYAASAATTVTVIVCLVVLVRGDDVGAIVSGVASIMTGGGVATIIKLKDSALKEFRVAQAAVRADCSGDGFGGTRSAGEMSATTHGDEEMLVRLTTL